MLEILLFLLGLFNNLLLIAIFYFSKVQNFALVKKIGRFYLLLSVPAVVALVLCVLEQKPLTYSMFLALFLAFLAFEALLDFVLKIDFRLKWNWKIIIPYVALYYASNYGLVVMSWKENLVWGLILLVLFVVQLIMNAISHKKPKKSAVEKEPKLESNESA